MTYREISVSNIEPNPHQPRQHFDETALRELADSIRENGLLEPIVVREVGDGYYMLIAGERRYRAALTIPGMRMIPATVLDVDEAQAFTLSVAENMNRADMTIMEEAGAFAQMLAFGHNVAAVARLLGKTVEFVNYRLALLNLIEETQQLVERGQMGADLAWYISRLGTQNQRTVTNRFARGEFVDQTAATDFARALWTAENTPDLFGMAEPTVEDRETAAVERATTRKALDNAERAIIILEQVARLTPERLAELLGPEVDSRMRQADRIRDLAQRTRLNLRKAKAVREVFSLHQELTPLGDTV